MDINGYLYAGQSRVGTLTNPLCVTYSATVPSELVKQVHPDFVPQPPEIRYVDKIVEKIVEKTIVKEVPVYNIKGDGLLFKLWYYIGCKMRWINGC